MKLLIKIAFFLSFLSVALGYFFNNFTSLNGKLYIGIGVLIFAFILMPLFIYYRYKGRIGDFIDRRMEKENDDLNNKK